MAFLVALLITLLALPCFTVYKMYSNYSVALKIGLPIIFTPVDPFHPLWVLLRPYLSPVLSCLPFGLGTWTHYSYLGWPWKDKYALHARYGGAFTIVTPAGNQVIVADAKAADDISTRRKDFVKKAEIYAPFNIFGLNVNTVNGETWQRHRKITTPPFNERNSSLVWTE